ncbi:formyltransferase family protein [Vibrio mediterranei]|uniref:Methionyl-tRNA formyltransferase n=1 Tax=Vibrio mediterranei TaxID=689 RepID=A0AAN1KMB5_9VIBR|nr:formyltransferase family protein [Vibrio mediterranei]ASI89251.1 hypothetical protein BSZ05_05195 [Vibrio mediterranei]
MYENEIVLAGSGHGGYVALKSLQAKFDSVVLLSEDLDLINELREEDKITDSLVQMVDSTIVCASYMKLIPHSILEKNTVINTHPSLLPKYRGIHSLAWAMINREEVVGFTIHLVNEYIDDGDILSQFSVSVGKKNSKEIMDIFDNYVMDNLGSVVKEYLRGNITPIKQDESEASWCCRRNLNDCLIDYNATYDELEALFRVLVPPYPYPILKTQVGTYYVINAVLIMDKTVMHSGRVVNIKGSKVYIKTKGAILVVDKLKNLDTGEYIQAKEVFRLGERIA